MFEVIKGGFKAIVSVVTSETAKSMARSVAVSTASLVLAHQVNKGINSVFEGKKVPVNDDPVGE